MIEGQAMYISTCGAAVFGGRRRPGSSMAGPSKCKLRLLPFLPPGAVPTRVSAPVDPFVLVVVPPGDDDASGRLPDQVFPLLAMRAPTNRTTRRRPSRH